MISKRVCLNIAQKTEVLKELDEGISAKAISEKYNISVHTAFKIKRQREVITRHADRLHSKPRKEMYEKENQ